METGDFINEYDKYFEMLVNFCPKYKVNNIKALTLKLAKSGRYYRGIKVFANGGVRELTMYRDKLSSELTAKWLLYYRNLFTSVLIKHPELSKYQVDIINDTFRSAMSSLKVERVSHNNSVNKYVRITLSSTVKNYMIKNSSTYHDQEYYKKMYKKFIAKYAIDNQAVPLDTSTQESTSSISELDDVRIEVEDAVSKNPIGKRMLEVMLNSKRKFNVRRVDKELYLTEDQCTPIMKKYIADAYNCIKALLVIYKMEDGIKKRMRRTAYSSIKYSFETGDKK